MDMRHVPGAEKTLVLHTQTGHPITPACLRSTFRTFSIHVDAKFSKITPMCVRGSHATSMLRMYRERKFGRGLSEAQFLADLARSVNTSWEMLKSTYILLSEAEDDEAASCLIDYMNHE